MDEEEEKEEEEEEEEEEKMMLMRKMRRGRATLRSTLPGGLCGVTVLIMMSKMWKLPEPNIGKTGVALFLILSRCILHN